MHDRVSLLDQACILICLFLDEKIDFHLQISHLGLQLRVHVFKHGNLGLQMLTARRG